MEEKEYVRLEYNNGNKLSQEYFKGSWTAASIFLPICFGIVAASYYTELLVLSWKKLLPMALASIFLYSCWWAHVSRYAGYNRSIWKRLRKIEEETGMNLHLKIKKDDDERLIPWRLRHFNFMMLLLLVAVWVIRLYLAPLVVQS